MPVEREGRRLERGMRVLELHYEGLGEPPPIEDYRPGDHGHRPWTRLVRDWVGELVGEDALVEIDPPAMAVNGRVGPEVLLRTDLEPIRELLDAGELDAIAAEAAEAVARLGPAGILDGAHDAEHWSTTLRGRVADPPRADAARAAHRPVLREGAPRGRHRRARRPAAPPLGAAVLAADRARGRVRRAAGVPAAAAAAHDRAGRHGRDRPPAAGAAARARVRDDQGLRADRVAGRGARWRPPPARRPGGDRRAAPGAGGGARRALRGGRHRPRAAARALVAGVGRGRRGRPADPPGLRPRRRAVARRLPHHPG